MRVQVIISAVIGVCAVALGGCNTGDSIISETGFINAANAAKKRIPICHRKKRRAAS
jgi:hypothetical protein